MKWTGNEPEQTSGEFVVQNIPVSDPYLFTTPLLQTKLYMPSLRTCLVPRLRLNEYLDRGLQGKLTLVSAPAGFGKTTLVAAWLAGREGESGKYSVNSEQLYTCPPGHLYTCWLSLDERDNDPACFWRYLIAALQTADSRIGIAAQTALSHPRLPPLEALITAVLNDLTAFSHPLLLVLDDYHLITAETIHQSLHFFLTHLPPHAHLLLLTRADPPLPLARLRAKGQLVELRAHDLRFTLPEIEVFLNQTMGFGLDQQEIETLAARTEGWAAGLQLATLSLQSFEPTTDGGNGFHHGNGRSQFLHAFAGDDRHVMDYLVDEVLNRQPDHIQNFLLQTSILEHLTAPLCDAVIGLTIGDLRLTIEPDSKPEVASQAILDHLEQANLFILPLDNRRQWYRYHRLFGELLRARLGNASEQLEVLHCRAAAWYQAHGYTAEAIRHALQAPNFEQAAHLVEQVYQNMALRGELMTLRGWLDALPPALVKSRPRLCLAHAWAFAYSSRHDQLQHALTQAEAALPEADTAEAARLQGEIFALRAVFTSLYGYTQQTQELARQALALVDEEQWILKALSYQALGNANRLQGQLTAANEAYQQAQTAFLTHGTPFLTLVPLARQGQVQVLQGRLHQAVATFEGVLNQAGGYSGESLVMAGESFVHLAGLYYEWNDLAKARECLEKELELARRGHMVIALLACYLMLARLEQAQNHQAAAYAALREGELLAAQYDFPYMTVQTTLTRVWLGLCGGHLDSAVSWADVYTAQPKTEAVPEILWETANLMVARIRLTQGKPDAAWKIVTEIQETAEKNGRLRTVLETLILQALIYQVKGQPHQAEETLRRALRLAEPEGYIRLFVDEGTPLAALLGRIAIHDHSEYLAKLIKTASDLRLMIGDWRLAETELDALTERELEILALMARGAPNQQIADELVIGVGTVKGHINHILGKLGSRNRTEAVARGRELNLLKT